MSSSDNKKGVQCSCGEFTPFSGYVFAHWHVELLFSCPQCGKHYGVLQGNVEHVGN